jgi:hypothetical protein
MPKKRVRKKSMVSNEQLRCPLGKKSRLRLVQQKNALVRCFLEESGPCPKELAFGGGFYCRAIYQEDAAEAK